MARAARIDCPAKINLFLEVLGRRPDGYHDIETIFQTVSLADTVTVALEGEGIEVTSDDPALPAGEGNLAGRAARALLEAARAAPAPRLPRGVRIRIAKRIPVGAGLGGGSADAAGTLVALAGLLGLGWGADRLEEVGASVGSDVPFLVRGGTALGEGRGERLTRLPPLEPVPILLAKPPVTVATRWAYDNLRRNLTRRIPLPTIAPREGVLGTETVSASVWNAFEDLVMGAYPAVREARDRMLAAGATCALMTGTGPTVFGLFADAAKLSIAESGLASNGFWCARVLPVGERPGGARREGGSETHPA